MTTAPEIARQLREVVRRRLAIDTAEISVELRDIAQRRLALREAIAALLLMNCAEISVISVDGIVYVVRLYPLYDREIILKPVGFVALMPKVADVHKEKLAPHPEQLNGSAMTGLVDRRRYDIAQGYALPIDPDDPVYRLDIHTNTWTVVG